MGNTLMSLLVSLGVDSSQLKKGMTTAESTVASSSKKMTSSLGGIQFKPTSITNGFSQLKGLVNENISTIDTASQAMMGFSASTLMGAAGIGVIVSQYKQAISETMDYAKQVRDLSRDIGGTPEDISKLIQAADDAEISFDTLKQGMIIANKTGIDVTIAGMQKLADQYTAIQNPLDRTRFLTDTFGRSGEQLGALMAMGGAGIRAAGDDAVKYGTVLDASAIAKTEAWRVSMDGLNDSLSGIKKNISLETIPALTALVNIISPVLAVYNQFNDLLNKLDPSLKGIIKTMYAWIDPVSASLAPLWAVYDIIKKIEDLVTGSNSVKGLSINATSSVSSYLSQGITHPGYGSADYVHPSSYGFAAGGTFTVPNGYPRDSFPMTVQSREKLKVTPPGKSSYEGPTAKEIGRETALALMQFGFGK